jgi:hypothetical protein
MSPQLLQLLHDLADILRSRTVDDEQRVVSVDDHRVCEADERDEAIGFRPDDAVARFELDDVPVDAVADLVVLDQLAKAVPIADI